MTDLLTSKIVSSSSTPIIERDNMLLNDTKDFDTAYKSQDKFTLNLVFINNFLRKLHHLFAGKTCDMLSSLPYEFLRFFSSIYRLVFFAMSRSW